MLNDIQVNIGGVMEPPGEIDRLFNSVVEAIDKASENVPVSKFS